MSTIVVGETHVLQPFADIEPVDRDPDHVSVVLFTKMQDFEAKGAILAPFDDEPFEFGLRSQSDGSFVAAMRGSAGSPGNGSSVYSIQAPPLTTNLYGVPIDDIGRSSQLFIGKQRWRLVTVEMDVNDPGVGLKLGHTHPLLNNTGYDAT